MFESRWQHHRTFLLPTVGIFCASDRLCKESEKEICKQHVLNCHIFQYYFQHIPQDLSQHYCVVRLRFALRTKSLQSANRKAKSVSQTLEDYWVGLRLLQIEIPAMYVLLQDNEFVYDSPPLSEACDFFLRLKESGRTTCFSVRKARTLNMQARVLGDRPIASYTASEAIKFDD